MTYGWNSGAKKFIQKSMARSLGMELYLIRDWTLRKASQSISIEVLSLLYPSAVIIAAEDVGCFSLSSISFSM